MINALIPSLVHMPPTTTSFPFEVLIMFFAINVLGMPGSENVTTIKRSNKIIITSIDRSKSLFHFRKKSNSPHKFRMIKFSVSNCHGQKWNKGWSDKEGLDERKVEEP